MKIDITKLVMQGPVRFTTQRVIVDWLVKNVGAECERNKEYFQCGDGWEFGASIYNDEIQMLAQCWVDIHDEERAVQFILKWV